jgi:hypothetical protein
MKGKLINLMQHHTHDWVGQTTMYPGCSACLCLVRQWRQGGCRLAGWLGEWVSLSLLFRQSYNIMLDPLRKLAYGPTVLDLQNQNRRRNRVIGEWDCIPGTWQEPPSEPMLVPGTCTYAAPDNSFPTRTNSPLFALLILGCHTGLTSSKGSRG